LAHKTHDEHKQKQNTTTCDRFFAGTPVSSTYKTDRNDITEILRKVALNAKKKNTKPDDPRFV
jgi:hypothetical protein